MGVQVKSAIRKDGIDGGFAVSAVSGLLTGVAAGTDSAGHLFAFRWAPGGLPVAQLAVITRLRARWTTIAGFTAAQEVGMDLAILRTYTAAHTGGTAVVPSKNRTTFPATQVPTNNIQVGTTGALTDGTHAAISEIRRRAAFAELAAAATVPKGAMEFLLSTEDLDRDPIVLAANEGLVIRNSIAMGAAGTARLVVDLEWQELAKYA
jgi:hypothetical protein